MFFFLIVNLFLQFLFYYSLPIIIKSDIGYFERFEDDSVIFEGDMVLPKNVSIPSFVYSFEKVKYKESELFEKNAIKNRKRLWPNGNIYYTINDTFNEDEVAILDEAFTIIERDTCIKFTKRHHEKDYILIFKGYGCYSNVGLVGGEQGMSIGNGCIFKGTVMHELMHVLGFYHEQSRTDRDEYVKIVWDNIIKGQELNFKSYTQVDIDHLGQPYDYKSIMHYTRYAFSKNDGETIHPYANIELIHSSLKFDLSDIDIKKINLLYNCKVENKVIDKCNTSVTTTPMPNVITTPVAKMICEDKIDACKDWAHGGECDDGLFMKLACPKACKSKCIESNTCKDYHINCDFWITDRKNYIHEELCTEYLNVICPLSCDKCKNR